MSDTATSPKLPFHLRGNYAPVPDEIEALDLPVQGALPSELHGLYLRNGPNPRDGTSGHWFFGDGMIHGLRLEDGRARWYRNRWVRTPQLERGARAIAPDGTRDITTGPANTHVVAHAGRILALVESSLPVELDCELATVGPHDFDGKLATPMTAHPKLCPLTGEMHFFGYDFLPPYLTYHVADAEGRLLRSEVVDVPGPTMIHDFAITADHVVFMDLPVVFDLERAMQGSMPYRWSDEYGARVGVMRREPGAEVRWSEVEPCYVFHTMNAYDDADGRVVVDVARYPELWRQGSQRFDTALLHRWTIDPSRGAVVETPMDERPIEFPRTDARRVGRPYRYGYAVANVSSVETASTSLLKYDLATGASVEHDFGPGRTPGEGVMVPSGPAAGEDEGWVLSLVHDASAQRSELVVLDAADFAAAPVARVPLPRRVPFGFHGSWIPLPD